MALTKLKGGDTNTIGDLPAVGSQAPAFEAVKNDLSIIKSEELKGSKVILNIFPSIDTGICAMSTQRFNKEASELENTKIVCISQDLPFALGRFCGAEGIETITTASAFRSSFKKDYGVEIVDGPLAGVCARAIVVLDAEGKVTYTELVPEITTEPNYEAAIKALA